MQISSSTQITVITANTHWGRMLETADGLQPVADADILLLQEAINIQEPDVKNRLEERGFDLVHIASKFGLAIALRSGSGVTLVPDSLKERHLQGMGIIERSVAQRGAARPHDFTSRGMIAVKFAAKNGQILTVVNAHPSVPLKPHARAVQVATIGQELNDSYYDGLLVVAGDMNHYRGPTAADKAMYIKTELQPVDLNNEPTWYVRGSEQEKYIKVGAFFRRRSIEYYNGQHDAVLYRGEGLLPVSVRVADIYSDHRAIIARFALSTAKS